MSNVFVRTNTDYNLDSANVRVTGNLIVENPILAVDGYFSGNLTVDGNVTYINVTELNVKDPIINLGRGANNVPLTSNDGKDRGEQLWYFDTTGNVEQSAFIGYQNTSGKLIAATNVSVTNDVVTVNSYGSFVVGTLEPTTINANGDIVTNSNLSAVGNVISDTVIANTFFGDGSGLTGIATYGNLISFGTTNVNIPTIGSDVVITVDGISNIAVVSTNGLSVKGNIDATGNITSASILADGIVSASGNITGSSVFASGEISAIGDITAFDVISTGLISAVGNITGNYILGNGSLLTGIDPTRIINGNSNVAISSSGGNIAVTVSGTPNVVVWTTTGEYITGSLDVSGNIVGGNLNIGSGTASVGGIVNNNANGVGNIGSSTVYFNTVFARATSAQYADLAENYTSDANYEPGTVLEFGGSREVTITKEEGTSRVAGVVSTTPSYLMNAGLTSEHVVAVALQGRVPTKVNGPVRKGDLLVAAIGGFAKADNNARAGTIIGKALEDFNDSQGIIEVVVGCR